MRAKSFFYVCAGLFLLALGYHLGARNAAADYVNGYFFSGTSEGPILVSPNGTGWHMSTGTPVSVTSLPPVPLTYGLVVGVSDRYAMTSSGYVWEWHGVWRGLDYFPVGATPAQRESMGSVKVRYR